MTMSGISSRSDADDSEVGLPAVGTCGWRCLDDVAFACQVVVHDADGTTISVQYADDQQVESGLHPNEFLLSEPGSRFSPRLQQEPHNDTDSNIYHDDQYERLHHVVRFGGESMSDSVFTFVASFLDHFMWIKQLILVSKRWCRVLMQEENWKSVRLPQENVGQGGDCLGAVRYAAAVRNLLLLAPAIRRSGSSQKDVNIVEPRAKAHQVVHELVLNDCPVTDALVLELVTQCPELERLSLRRCNQISFLLLYELTRLAKEKKLKKNERFHLQHVDVWLCRGISPAYVDQLRSNGVFTRTGLNVTGPGFFILEVSASTEQWIKRNGVIAIAEGDSWQQQQAQACSVKVEFQCLSVCFVLKARLRALFEETHQAARELRNLREHVDEFPLAMIPLVCRLESNLRKNDQSCDKLDISQYALVGMPSTSNDMIQLVAQYEEKHVQTQLSSALASIAEPRGGRLEGVASSTDKTTKPSDPEQDESLDARAEKVFAMLRQTTQDLEAQVAHLESQVRQMTVAKDHAQREYQIAQLELARVAKEADRALLRLATSSDTLPPPPPAFSAISTISTISTMSGFTEPNSETQAGAVGSQDGDELLPPLPSNEQLQHLGCMLQSQGFGVLDGFLGSDLSVSVHRDIEKMYLASQACNLDAPSSEANSSNIHAEFKLGELAGGNTGRNLRYKMEHVRGDYMLWMDENDSFSPTSVRQVLRQMDRLVLERLSSYNMELRGSSLMRKKAMATCYPGNSARYTRHCDNPNKNGRKLTAILYLNANWQPEHGGELQLHLPSSALNKDHGETKIAPLMDRLLLFFSDRRVPHEVLPCFKRNRFALTLWYLDYDEFMNAQVFGSVLEDERDEEKRIEKEIAGFTNTTEL